MITRRKLLLAIGAGPVVTPLASFGQKPVKIWHIGVLWPESRSSTLGNRFGVILKRLGELGYVEGQNFVIDWRSADGEYERLDSLAAELVKLKVDVIVVAGTRAAQAARKATVTIPIVSTGFGDPVAAGLAASLARPGGNVTGLSNLTGDLEFKRLELLVNSVPKAFRIAQLVNPDNVSGMARIASLRAAAKKLDRDFVAVEVRATRELEDAFVWMAKQRIGALMVLNEASISEHAPRIAELALRNKLPSIYGFARGAEVGGLISYGPDSNVLYVRTAELVDKIFKGAKPGEIPIEQPTKFEMVVNMKTAKALGITLPQSILVQATKVIE